MPDTAIDSSSFLPFSELNVGFTNAENYRRRENKELLSKYFVRDEYLERLLDSNIYFLVGEKGTGKTAYATFLKNNEYKREKVSLFDVRQTEYQKFLELKRQGHLPLSQYSEVWRTLLLICAAWNVLETSGTPDFLKRFTKLGALKNALEEFYENAFAPEIVKILGFVESAEVASSLLAKHAGVSAGVKGTIKSEQRDSNTIFQTNLLKVRQAFEAGLSSLRLEHNSIIFIDGIDVRPADISYSDYFECVRGLIEAVWAINNDFLANIKDSKGRIKVVLLVRPDIFLRTGLHNLNTKLRDNSVFLNWATTYKDYRGSLLFKVADRLLSAQQSPPISKIGVAWDYYFPFHAENVKAAEVSGDKGVNSFLAFLRFGYYRPRDVNAMIGTMQDIVKKKNGYVSYVTAADFNDPSFRDAHAEYLLGEIRDQLLFYYSQDEYDLFLQFFGHLRGKIKFTCAEFLDAFNEFISECAQTGKTMPQFFESANVFLQFLYEQNVVCYIEKDARKDSDRERFIRWCFRERTLANMAPKVRPEAEYEIFYGLSKALNVGRRVHVRKQTATRLVGTVVSLDAGKGFGFVRGGPKQQEYYFKTTELQGEVASYRLAQKVSFEPTVKYGKLRAIAVRRSS